MALLVTGSAGYVGSHDVIAVTEAGECAVVPDDRSNGCRNAVPAGMVFGDVGDSALVYRLCLDHGVAVVHLAAKAVGELSTDGPLDDYVTSTVKSRSLLPAAGVKYLVNTRDVTRDCSKIASGQR